MQRRSFLVERRRGDVPDALVVTLVRTRNDMTVNRMPVRVASRGLRLSFFKDVESEGETPAASRHVAYDLVGFIQHLPGGRRSVNDTKRSVNEDLADGHYISPPSCVTGFGTE